MSAILMFCATSSLQSAILLTGLTLLLDCRASARRRLLLRKLSVVLKAGREPAVDLAGQSQAA